jgi:hypothetical protein
VRNGGSVRTRQVGGTDRELVDAVDRGDLLDLPACI